MLKSDILKKIIEANGSCEEFANKAICRSCPIYNLKKRVNGDSVNCLEAVLDASGVDVTDELDPSLGILELNNLYKKVAENELTSIELKEKILGVEID